MSNSVEEIQRRCRAAAERFEALAGPAKVDAVVSADLLLEAASLLRGYHQSLLLDGLPERRVAAAARAKANVLRTDPGWRKRFKHPNEQAFALDHYASDLESGLWADWLVIEGSAASGTPEQE